MIKKMILAVLCGLSLCAAALADGHRNVHYYSGASAVRWDLLTHLNYFDTSVIDSNGTFIPHTPAELADIQELQQQAGEHGKILMVCYGGSFDGVFKEMLEAPTKRAAFIQAIADNVMNLNLTGIDLDWEYPSNAYEYSLMDTFYTEIRAEIGPEPLLTAAVAGWQVQLSANTVNESLDWIQTMAYYWRTASQSAQDLARWTNAGVAKGKINLGVPFAGNSNDETVTVPWDIPYYQFVDSISPFDPNVNEVYFEQYQGTFDFVGVNLQKEKMRVAAAGGNGTMVWHHRTDVEDPERSLAVSLHDESVRHVAVIDGFELPVGTAANHLYQAGDAAITGTYTRVSGFTGAEATLVFAGGPWSGGNITSFDHPTGYAFPSGAQIRFDYKVLDTHPDVSIYLRLIDGEGDYIQQPIYHGLTAAGWKRAVYNRAGFSSNVSFNENDVRRYKILAQIGNVNIPAFTSRVVFDNLVMIAPDPAHRPIQDRDADGYSDRLETLMGTSAIDAADAPPTPLEGLRTWWKFDDNFSQLAREEVQQVHAKLYGGSWTNGRSGHAIELDGIDDRIVMDSTAALAGATDFSLCAWVKTVDTNGGMILQQRDTTSTDGQYRLRCNPDGTVNFSIHNAGDQFDFASTTSINDGSWHHVVAMRNGTNGALYIDGVLTGQGSGPLKVLAEHAVAVGYNHRDQDDYLAGTLDDIRIFSRALSTTDITHLFTDTDTDTLNDDWETAQYGNPSAYAPSDNPEGDTLDMFAEMAFGGNALAYDAPGDFTTGSITNNSMVFSYRRTKNHTPFRVAYQLQSCNTLEAFDWTDSVLAPAYVIDDPDGSSEWVTHIIPIPEGTDQQFFRSIAAPQ